MPVWLQILAWSHTFEEIDYEIISTVILLPSTESFKKDCFQLQGKVCARSTGKLHIQACPGKSVVRWTHRPTMTIAVNLGRKATKQTFHSKRGGVLLFTLYHMSRNMRFPTMWYVPPAKPRISLRIRAVWSEPLLVACEYSMTLRLLAGHHLELKI